MMNKMTFALLCTFIYLLHFKEGTGIPHGTRGKVQTKLLQDSVDLKEKIHDKIAYIAAIIDNYHLKFIEYLQKIGNGTHQTEAALNTLLTEHMMNVTNKILPDVESLIEITNNREKSADVLNKHFAEDHVDPMLKAIFGEDTRYPKFYNTLRKTIADMAQARIRSIFQNYKKRT